MVSRRRKRRKALILSREQVKEPLAVEVKEETEVKKAPRKKKSDS